MAEATELRALLDVLDEEADKRLAIREAGGTPGDIYIQGVVRKAIERVEGGKPLLSEYGA